MPVSSFPPSACFTKDAVFVVNVMRARPGRQKVVLEQIRDIVLLASRKPGFLWSALGESLDGETVVNVEAIADDSRVEQFFSDPIFAEKFRALGEECAYEFHLYRIAHLILPEADG